MASFCAGFIKHIDTKGDVSKAVYKKVTQELDSYGVKVSAVKTRDGYNYIAFLTKTKIIKENVLPTVAKITNKSIVVFEVDYKQVGVICENGKIIDYILDEVTLYAKSNDLAIHEVSNTKGNDLVFYNIAKDKRDSRYSFTFLTFVITAITIVSLGFFYYTNALEINLQKKDNLEKQYINLVKLNFDKTSHEIRNPNFSEKISKIEDLCVANNIRLRNIEYKDKMFCISFKDKIDEKVLHGFKLHQNNPNEVVYCSEKI